MGDVSRGAVKGVLGASALALCLSLVPNGDVAAMDTSLSPSQGSVTLREGFQNDPYARRIRAGGSNRADRTVRNCPGYVARAPDFRVFYRSGNGGPYSLSFYVESRYDTTLVVNDPRGRWYCDDDSYGNSNPIVKLANPVFGQYDVWVGTYDRASGIASTLYVSELE